MRGMEKAHTGARHDTLHWHAPLGVCGLDREAVGISCSNKPSHLIVLGQVKVNEKSNEIIAIPALLDMMSIEGAVVTIDAMG